MRIGPAHVFVLLTAVAVPLVGRAAPESAVEWLRIGIERYTAHDYESARVAFAHAYEIAPQPGTLLELGLAELQSGHTVQAARDLRRYLQADSEPLTKRQAVKDTWLPRAEAALGHVHVSMPAGSEVSVDGLVVDATEDIDVAPGDHELVVRRDASSERRQIQVGPGQAVSAAFEIPVAPPAPLSIEPTRSAAPAGWPTAKVATVTSLGAAAVISAGLAVTFAALSRNEANTEGRLHGQLSSNRACAGTTPEGACGALHDAIRKQDAFASVSDGLYIGAGVLEAAVAAPAVFWPSRHASLAAQADGHGGGLSIEGEW